MLPPLLAGEGGGGLRLLREAIALPPSNPLPASPCEQGEEFKPSQLPPLLAGEGWGGVRLLLREKR
jgi:hypothetical protein